MVLPEPEPVLWPLQYWSFSAEAVTAKKAATKKMANFIVALLDEEM